MSTKQLIQLNTEGPEVSFVTPALRRQAQRPFLLRKLSMGFRVFIAVLFFALAGLFSVGSNLNLAYAKKLGRRFASRVRQVKHQGQFRLLNIYKAMVAQHPRVADSLNHRTTGLASWYGGMFHGRLTAMGTRYNMNAMTAAHRSLPLGTWVKVTDLGNDKTIVVQVTDRGPYVGNRIMDLSYGAASKLGYANKGTTNIKMQVIPGDFASYSDAELAAANLSDVATGALAAFEGISVRSENIALGMAGMNERPVAMIQQDSTSTAQPVLAALLNFPGHTLAPRFS